MRNADMLRLGAYDIEQEEIGTQLVKLCKQHFIKRMQTEKRPTKGFFLALSLRATGPLCARHKASFSLLKRLFSFLATLSQYAFSCFDIFLHSAATASTNPPYHLQT